MLPTNNSDSWWRKNMKKSTLALIARNKLRFFIGMSFFGILMSIFGFLTFAKVWSGTFEYYGVPPIIIYITVPVMLVLGCWYVGFWYEMNKLWEYEVSHLNKNINPEFVTLIETVDRLETKINELQERLTRNEFL